MRMCLRRNHYQASNFMYYRGESVMITTVKGIIIANFCGKIAIPHGFTVVSRKLVVIQRDATGYCHLTKHPQ